MSLLATEGIGVFLNRHYALDQVLQGTEYRELTTHKATWKLLSAWSCEPGKAQRLLEVISLESKTLSEWLTAAGVVKPAQELVAEEWLATWSVDLAILSTDGSRRNEMSYRPTRIRAPATPPVDPSLEIVAPLFNSWTALEPLIGGASAALDVSLLRRALALVIEKGLCSHSSISKAILSLKNEMPDRLYQALMTESSGASAIFDAARIGDTQGRVASPILARALLMLRLASASTASLLATANVSKADLEFWWSALGADLGLWEAAADIETFSDLWTDVAEAKDDADARISAMAGGGTVRSVASILSRDLSLTQFSRAPMWLLGLD